MTDEQAFVAASDAIYQCNLTFCDTEALGQELDEVLIGLAINRRCRDTDLEAVVAVGADDLILAGAGLDANVQ